MVATGAPKLGKSSELLISGALRVGKKKKKRKKENEDLKRKGHDHFADF